MAHEQILSRESVWLHIHVGIGKIVDEARFSNVRESCYDECSCIAVNRWKSTKMLANFFQVAKT